MVIVRQSGVVVDDRQQAEAGDDGRHRPAEAAVRAADVDADAVLIGIGKLHRVAVDQPVRLRAGQVFRRAVVGAVGRVADANGDDRAARRHVHRGIEGQRDVDVLAMVVGAAVARRRHDLRPIGAVGARAAPDPDPESLVVFADPILTGPPKQHPIVNGPSRFVAPILSGAVRGTELGDVVVGATGDAIEHEPVVGIRLQERVGRRLPLVVRVVVQLTSREGGDLPRPRPDVAVQAGVDRHVPALPRIADVQPDTLQLIAASMWAGSESLHQPILVLGQDKPDVGS